MTTSQPDAPERAALIALWNRVPGTRPLCVDESTTAASGFIMDLPRFWFDPFDFDYNHGARKRPSDDALHALVAALACAAIETWLETMAPITEFCVSPMPNPLSAKALGELPGQNYQIEINFGHRQEAFQRPTKLLALIAAANAVAGVTP